MKNISLSSTDTPPLHRVLVFCKKFEGPYLTVSSACVLTLWPSDGDSFTVTQMQTAVQEQQGTEHPGEEAAHGPRGHFR